jgi:hypothetical protein
MAAAKGNKPSEFLKENRWIPLTLILRFLPHQAPTEDDSSEASKAPNLNHTHTNKNPSLISRTILDQTFAVDFPFPQSWKL